MIEIGKTYTAYGQGTSITPRTVQVTVVWIDGDAVHYRKEGDPHIHRTSKGRFEEIIKPR